MNVRLYPDFKTTHLGGKVKSHKSGDARSKSPDVFSVVPEMTKRVVPTLVSYCAVVKIEN